MKLSYVAIFTFYEEDGSYGVEFPDLPGCATGGSCLINAIEMAEDAAAGWLLGELEEERKLPVASDIRTFGSIGSKSFASVVVVNMDEYIKKHSKKAVRKNITIPAWLNAIAEKEHVNFSQVLQDALFLKLQSSI